MRATAAPTCRRRESRALHGVIQTPMAEPKKIASALGWTDDQFKLLFQSLGTDGKEATWSMGDDAPPAFVSSMHRPIWDYCKQRFAQVTNPAIDPLRESHVMSLDVYLGHNLVAGSPILDAGQAAQVESLLQPASRIDITFEAAEGVNGALAALERIRKEAERRGEVEARRGGRSATGIRIRSARLYRRCWRRPRSGRRWCARARTIRRCSSKPGR